jgi:hypothetical protein
MQNGPGRPKKCPRSDDRGTERQRAANNTAVSRVSDTATSTSADLSRLQPSNRNDSFGFKGSTWWLATGRFVVRQADGTVVEGDGLLAGHARAEIRPSEVPPATRRRTKEPFIRRLLRPREFLHHFFHSIVYEFLRKALSS